EEGRMRLSHLCRLPYFRAALVAIFLGGALEMGVAQWLPAYAEISLRFSKWEGGMALLVFSVAMAVGRMTAGLLGHRINAFKLMQSCCWLSALLVSVTCFAPWPDVSLVASVSAGLTISCL